jgi:hypothetical protein
MISRRAILVFGLLLIGCSSGTGPPEKGEEEAPAFKAEGACPNFELEGELARDTRTGLIWDRFVAHTTKTHEEAEATCAERGARLPTRAETLALRADSTEDGCLLPSCAFKGDRCATIQCGSEVPGFSAHWGVAFSGGGLVMVPAGAAEALLCVR